MPPYHRITFNAMASPCEILIAGVGADAAAALGKVGVAEVLRIEQRWSRYRSDNIVHRINTAQGRAITVDDEEDAETARFLDYAAHLHAWSNGLFDISTGALRRVWRFTAGSTPPTPAEIAALLPLVGWQRVLWQDGVLQMPAGMELDFGGIGKEYAADRALALMTQATPTAAILVNLGGDLAANRPPQADMPWQIGVEGGTSSIQLRSGGVATSGDTYRFLQHGNVRYSHLLHPQTGWAVAHVPASITVTAASCVEAGVLSSLALLKAGCAASHPADAAKDFLAAQGADFYIQA